MKAKLLLTELLLTIALCCSWRAEGQSWTLTSAPTNNWTSVACSADGSRLIAGSDSGPLLTSTNSGSTWQTNDISGVRSVACSADGTHLVAAAQNIVYTSTNSAISWSSTLPDASLSLTCIAASADGTMLFLVGASRYATQIYMSTNWGETWQQLSGSPYRYWNRITCSADGMRLVATESGALVQGGVYLSTDFGGSWTQASLPTQYWGPVTCSADGRTVLVNGYIPSSFNLSTNFASDWLTTSPPTSGWWSLACSADGTHLAGAGAFGPIYTSNDSGATWISNNAPVANWSGIASSADGNFLVAVAAGGGIYTWRAPPAPGTVLWSYDVGNNIWSSPAVGPDGTVYVTIPTGLCAVTNNGSIASNKWYFSVGMDFGSPAIALNGIIYQGSDGGNLYAIKPDGSVQWSVSLGKGGSPAIGPDNTIYFQGGSSLSAISPAGMVKWTTFVGSGANSPVIAPDGTIYAGSYGANRLYAFNADGTQRWFRDLHTNVEDSPAVGADRTVYVTSGGLLAFAPDGTQLWETTTYAFSGASPVVGPGGVIYLREFSAHVLTAVSSIGQVLWQAVQDYQKVAPPTAPAIDLSGTIYYCAQDSLWALSSQGQVMWGVPGSSPPGYAAITSPAVGPDGTVYVALGTKVLAVAGASTAAANSSWPMFRQNARHTGKIERPFLAAPQKGTDSNFTFQLYPNQLGLTYTVESSTNLSTWTTVTNILATTLPTQVTDPSASNAPSRFYRASVGNK